MHPRQTPAGQSGFTLIELLVVITIVAVLATLVFPVLSRVQAKGYETKTLSNMRVMGIALMTYAGDNSYQLPGRVAAVNGVTPPKWPTALQPYVQDLTVYGSPIPDVGGKSYKLVPPRTYLDNNTNYTSYIYNGGNDSAPAGGATTTEVTYPRLNVIGLPSQTILLGVPNPLADNFYMDFTEGNNNDVLNKTAFSDGTPYVFADGSVRVLSVASGANHTTNTAAPVSSATYSDWLWLFDKNRTDIIP